MKKDRNCMMNNPYMNGMPMPGMPNDNMYIQNPNMMMGGFVMDNNVESQINQLQGQINMLDKRVTKLENMVMTPKDGYNNYGNSNYHVM